MIWWIIIGVMLGMMVGVVVYVGQNQALPFRKYPDPPAIPAKKTNLLCAVFQEVLNKYLALPPEYQMGDLYESLLGIQEIAGGREVVQEHFYDGYWRSEYESNHYRICSRSNYRQAVSGGCNLVPKFIEIQNAVEAAEAEVEKARAANIEFENRHKVESSAYIIEAIRGEIETSKKVREELKGLEV